MKTTIAAGGSTENGGRFAGGHFAGGHDGIANLRKPITAYDFHVRYNNSNYLTANDIQHRQIIPASVNRTSASAWLYNTHV